MTFELTCLAQEAFELGGGLALVLSTPSGATYLYDTGIGYPAARGYRDYNCGRDTVMPFLRRRGVSRLAGVFCSHAHYDHFGGLRWLADHIEIGTLYDPGYRYPGDASADWAQELRDYDQLRQRLTQRTGYRQLLAGAEVALDDTVRAEVLAPPAGFFTAPSRATTATDLMGPPEHYLLNANSLILRIVHGDVVFVLGGDIETAEQIDCLLPAVPADKLRCDVLVAPGHGIHSTPAFAETARPALTIASVGRSIYDEGIPAADVYGAVGSGVLVTCVDGSVSVTSDGRGYEVATGSDVA